MHIPRLIPKLYVIIFFFHVSYFFCDGQNGKLVQWKEQQNHNL